MFCKKCGAILRPKKIKGKNVLSCSCGYADKEGKAEIVEKVEKEKELEVIQEGAGDETLPTTEETCDKCGNKEAWYWLQQMRASDEPESKFLKCTKCKHIWREK